MTKELQTSTHFNVARRLEDLSESEQQELRIALAQSKGSFRGRLIGIGVALSTWLLPPWLMVHAYDNWGRGWDWLIVPGVIWFSAGWLIAAAATTWSVRHLEYRYPWLARNKFPKAANAMLLDKHDWPRAAKELGRPASPSPSSRDA